MRLEFIMFDRLVEPVRRGPRLDPEPRGDLAARQGRPSLAQDAHGVAHDLDGLRRRPRRAPGSGRLHGTAPPTAARGEDLVVDRGALGLTRRDLAGEGLVTLEQGG